MNAETEDEDSKEILIEKRDPAMDFCLQSAFTALDQTWCLN